MAKQKNLLIYRLGSLGDTVIALPCFHLLAKKFEGYQRILLTNHPVHAKAPAASSIMGESGLIHKYMSYPVGTRNIIEFSKVCWKIRRLGIRTAVYLTAPRGEAVIRRDERFLRLCGVKEIIGIPAGDLAKHRYDPVADRYEAEASRLARCLAPLGDINLNALASWDLLFTEKETARATRALGLLHGAAFIVVAISSKKQVTDWGIENWKALMPDLRRKFPNHALVFVGSKEDRPASDKVAAEWGEHFLNVCGELSPRESAAVMKQADLFIGVDSGPMHLAASVDAPCVSIFSAHNLPGVWFPFGKNHEVIYHKTECFGCKLDVCNIEKKRCILSISVDEVVAAAVRAEERSAQQRMRKSVTCLARSL